MPGTMVEKLQLVVDATTGSSESRFQRLTAVARETGDTSVRSADSVTDAANRVAQAQLKAQDAVGNLRVAEQRLADLRTKGNASATQLAAAEEKVASAERRVHLASRDAAAAVEAQTSAYQDAEQQTGHTGRAQEKLGQQLGNLKGEVIGLVAGTSLATWLIDAGKGFLEGARGANALSISMNATVEEGGALAQMFRNLGLEADDLLEIQAQFAQTSKDGLTAMGTELQHNTDGTVNWARSLTDTLEQLQRIPDATKRNQLGFAMFGEEGYKQLSRLLTSGMSVRDIMDAIGTPFTVEDVKATQQFDTAMLRLQLTTGGLGRELGRNVIPLVTDLLQGFGALVSVVTAVPGPIAATTAAAIVLGLTGFSPAAVAGARLAVVMAAARTEAALASATFIEGAAAAGIMGGAMTVAAVASGAAMAGARAGAARLLGLLGGPLGIGLIALGAAFHFASKGSDDLKEHARKTAVELDKLKGSQDAVEIATRKSANDLEENAGYWERSAAYVKGHAAGLHGWEKTANSLITPFQRLTMGFGDTADTAKGFQLEIDEARKELEGFAGQQQNATATSKSLNDRIAEGETTGRGFADAVKAAAEAQNAQSRTSDTAKAAIDAYNAVTRDAVQTVHGLIDAQLAAQDADYGYLSALDDLKAARDDEKTSVDEVAKAHTAYKAAALQAGDAAADAAVEAAKAAGTIMDPLTEANIRATALLDNLRTKMNTPGLSKGAHDDLQGLIDQLQTAKDKGDVQALITLTGVDATKSQLDDTTKDRDTTVKVETRGGPAVEEYMGRLTRERLAIIRVETRGGPDVDNYVDRLAHERLAIIRVETRGGPDVDRYLDDLAGQRRTAVIDVRRPGSGAPGGPTGAPAAARMVYGAPAVAGGAYGAAGDVVVQQLTVQVLADGAGKISQQSLTDGGRQLVRQLGAYTRQNGNGWLKGLTR